MFDSFNPTESLIPDDGAFVFASTGGDDRSTVQLPYIEQRGDAGGPDGWDSVGVIAIIAPAEHDNGSNPTESIFPTETIRLLGNPGAPDGFEHTQPIEPGHYVLWDHTFDKPLTDGLTVDPTNPNAEVNHSEIIVVRLLDTTTPKVETDDRYTFAFDGYSNTGDGGIIIDFTPGPDDNAGLPAVQTDDGLSLTPVQSDNAVTWTAIAMAESGGNTDVHNPHGEDSRGLWQINLDPAQTDNPDTFDCSELVQWASESVELLGQPTVATEGLTIVH